MIDVEKVPWNILNNRGIPLSTVNNALAIETPSWSIKARFGWMQERVGVPVPARAPTLRGGVLHEFHQAHIHSKALTGTLTVVERMTTHLAADLNC